MRAVAPAFVLAAAAAATAAPPPINPAGAARLRAALTRLTEFRAGLPAEHLALAELARHLEFDPARLLAFVRDEVAWQPYRGMLRGPRGALWARAGNALDRALLARELLLQAGLEARLAGATLGADAARGLLAAGLRPPPPRPEIGGAAVDDFARRVVAETALTPAAWRASVEAGRAAATARRAALAGETRRVAAALAGAVRAGGAALAPAPPPAAWAEEARRYYWVQWRISASEPWRDDHLGLRPSAPDAAPPAPAEVWRSGYPEGVRYRLRVALKRERRRGAAADVADLMTPWEGFADRRYGRALRVQLLPDGARGPAVLRDRGRVLRESSRFLPLIDGALAPGAKALTRDGELTAVGGSDAAAALAGLGGAGFSGALTGGGKGAAGSADPAASEGPGELAAVWLEFEWRGPGDFVARATRPLLDRRPAEAPPGAAALEPVSPAELGARMTAEYRVVPDLGPVPGAATFSGLLAYLTAYEETFAKALLDPDGPALADLGRHTEPVHLPLLTRMHAVPHGGGEASYRYRPGLVLVRAQLGGGGERLQREIDIVSNPRRGYGVGPSGAEARPEAALFAGVWETAMEAEEPPRAAAATRESAFARLAGAALAPVGDPAALPRDLGPRAGGHVRADLAAGRRVYLGPGADAAAAWWRVDPATGTTLGRVGSGAGSSMNEYQITVNEVSKDLTIVLNGYGVASCLGKEHMGCCLGHTALLGSAGFVGGAVIAAGLTGKAAWAWFALWDVGGGVGSTFIPDPCNE